MGYSGPDWGLARAALPGNQRRGMGHLGFSGRDRIILRKNWAARFTQIAILFMAAWYWFDRLVLVRSEAAQTNLVFMGLLTVSWQSPSPLQC
jgi:hypothetical protein